MMEKIYLDSPEARPQPITVQSIGPSLVTRAMDSLIAAQAGFGVVRDGSSVVLVIGESGLSIARKLHMRVTRTHPERFVLIGDGSPIDFELVRDIPINVFVGADESLEVLLEALEAAARGSAFCSPHMVPALVGSAESASSPKILPGADRFRNERNVFAEYCAPNIHVLEAGSPADIELEDPITTTQFDEIERHVTRANRLARALGLTDREWETAALAVEGLANAEIAELLAMSVPTVKFNLYRAYQKLGIRRRSQIANALMIMPAGSLMFAANRKRAANRLRSHPISVAVND